MILQEALLIHMGVTIDYLRDKPEAVAYLDALTNPMFLSVIIRFPPALAAADAGAIDGSGVSVLGSISD